jgi:hypothetical protein
VVIDLFSDIGRTGTWTTLLHAEDDGTHYGGAPILSAGYGGIRTDFMDVSFEDFRMSNL